MFGVTVEARTRLKGLSIGRSDIAKYVHPDDLALMRAGAAERTAGQQ